jgi:hypothetical protein
MPAFKSESITAAAALDLKVQAELATMTNLRQKNALYRQYRNWTRTGHQGNLIVKIAQS